MCGGKTIASELSRTNVVIFQHLTSNIYSATQLNFVSTFYSYCTLHSISSQSLKLHTWITSLIIRITVNRNFWTKHSRTSIKSSKSDIPKRITWWLHFFSSGYLIRYHNKNSQKYLYFRKKFTFIRTWYRQNQHLWRQNGNKMSPENQGVFQLRKKVTFQRILAFCRSRKWWYF